jgi:hypothetical protein
VTTSESALDSKVLLQATQIVNERIQSLKVGRVLFDVTTFLNRIADLGSEGTEDSLSELGRRIGPLISKAPGIEFMYVRGSWNVAIIPNQQEPLDICCSVIAI